MQSDPPARRDRRPRAVLAAAVLLSLAAGAGEARAEGSGRLVAGAVVAPSLVAPGWLADHLASWTKERAAYAAPCRNDEVENELAYLRKLVERDQDLRDAARAQLLHAVIDGDS
ncbi:MAG: hypothetical protein JO258_05040, partial [Alphaproteobacteria bacterium]|nr:hypothetical protein [Alphaproteobacteria bacterium]